MAGDRRVDDAQYAGRVNAAADLLEAGVPVSEAARALAGRVGVSARQARRDAGEAAPRGPGAGPGDTAGVTGQPPVPPAAAGGGAVGGELVFGRHAAADLSAAYAILVPERRARVWRAGQEEGPRHDERGDLCPGLLGPAEAGPDDCLPDRGAAGAGRAAGA